MLTPQEIDIWIKAVKKCLKQEEYGVEEKCVLCHTARAFRAQRLGAGRLCEYCITRILLAEHCTYGIDRHRADLPGGLALSAYWDLDACRSSLRELLEKLEGMK